MSDSVEWAHVKGNTPLNPEILDMLGNMNNFPNIKTEVCTGWTVTVPDSVHSAFSLLRFPVLNYVAQFRSEIELRLDRTKHKHEAVESMQYNPSSDMTDAEINIRYDELTLELVEAWRDHNG